VRHFLPDKKDVNDINKNHISDLLKNEINGIDVLMDEPMKNHTSFHIGGNADIFIPVKTKDEIISAVSLLKSNNIKITVIGNGSNLLVSDDGIEGAVLSIGKEFSSVTQNGTTIIADAGILLSRLSSFAASLGLTGLEFASGIPGTLGGAVMMNAGAYGGEMKDCVVSTTYIDADGNLCTVNGEEHLFSYRKSCFKEGDIILSSTLSLQAGDKDAIKDTMRTLSEKRREKQPLEYPSAGSTFKRPEGAFAAKLIDDAGLRGFAIGDAQVSEKHCGFVINRGNASFKDVLSLMEHIQKTVKDKFGYELEPEVKIIGRNTTI